MALERKRKRCSGAKVFTDTRVLLFALNENLECGATISDVVEWFPGVDERQVRVVLKHEVQAQRTALAR